MRKTALLLLFSAPILLQSQNENSVGIRLGIPIQNEMLPEQRRYIPFQLLFYREFVKIIGGKRHRLSMYLEPQLAWVHFSPKHKREWEGGTNLGLEYRLKAGHSTTISTALGSGPHFISVETRQQSRGFIFSDNFTLGFYQVISRQRIQLAIMLRFRHISNANLKQPNRGIDNWFLLAGFTRPLLR